jgi:hypothetical protein
MPDGVSSIEGMFHAAALAVITACQSLDIAICSDRPWGHQSLLAMFYSSVFYFPLLFQIVLFFQGTSKDCSF